jgi:hypothetical protein
MNTTSAYGENDPEIEKENDNSELEDELIICRYCGELTDCRHGNVKYIAGHVV